jgi:hypothetical protein
VGYYDDRIGEDAEQCLELLHIAVFQREHERGLLPHPGQRRREPAGQVAVVAAAPPGMRAEALDMPLRAPTGLRLGEIVPPDRADRVWLKVEVGVRTGAEDERERAVIGEIDGAVT